jgi:intein/homing endonuclease
MFRLDNSKVEFSLNDVKRKLKVPNFLTEELAEDIGFHLGDGYLGNYSTNSNPHKYEINYSGNLRDEKFYYNCILLKRKYRLFGARFKIWKNKSKNNIICRFLSKALVTFYESSIGIKSGKKLSAQIPDIILKAPNNIKIAFIRGLFDADGCLTFSKKHKHVAYYPIIEIGLISKSIIISLKFMLTELGFSFSYYTMMPSKKYRRINQRFCISLSGVFNVKKWVKIIGFRNQKNAIKYDIWKVRGVCPSEKEVLKIIKEWAGRDSNSRFPPILASL